MPLSVPNLDDRTFDQLSTEALGLIAKNFPEWTDHNPSDPGITLMELFAFLIDVAIYQTNRVPERSLEHFAGLVGVKRAPDEPIEKTLRRALEELEDQYRAVTEVEFETLAKQAAAIARAKAVVEVVDTMTLTVESGPDNTNTITVTAFHSGAAGLRRSSLIETIDGVKSTHVAKAVPANQPGKAEIDLSDSDFAQALKPGDQLKVTIQPHVFPNEQFVKVIIVPDEPNNPEPVPSQSLRQAVFTLLRSRRLITTRLQVVEPEYTPVRVAAVVVRDIALGLEEATVKQKVKSFLSPLIGGVDGTGWHFGRPVFRSELYQLIEGIDAVDHVRRLLLNGDESTNDVSLVTHIARKRTRHQGKRRGSIAQKQTSTNDEPYPANSIS